ncbi:hypothetical protein GGU11DRAFT_758286 [Lentinula aff. detonsa]|nr:hypothetical protein GGU11DRAFT_758286 [Lentinula aff. detonsa]
MMENLGYWLVVKIEGNKKVKKRLQCSGKRSKPESHIWKSVVKGTLVFFTLQSVSNVELNPEFHYLTRLAFVQASQRQLVKAPLRPGAEADGFKGLGFDVLEAGDHRSSDALSKGGSAGNDLETQSTSSSFNNAVLTLRNYHETEGHATAALEQALKNVVIEVKRLEERSNESRTQSSNHHPPQKRTTDGTLARGFSFWEDKHVITHAEGRWLF